MSTTDKLLRIEKQLQKLDERLEKLLNQQVRSFYKAVQQIFKEGFCPEFVLKILVQARETATSIQKQEEEARTCSSVKESSNDEPSKGS